MMISYNKKQTI